MSLSADYYFLVLLKLLQCSSYVVSGEPSTNYTLPPTSAANYQSFGMKTSDEANYNNNVNILLQ